MKISKNMKKLMSSIMVMALAFSTVFIAQPVKADTTPKVEVVGATLRKDGGSGKQALRFAIKVSNADKANDCGITITANGKTQTISIANGQKNLFEKDDKNNTVTYTAVVTGIPASYFSKDFEFYGSVTPIGDSVVTSTNPVTKNLKDVAFAANYMLNDDGQLEAFTAEEKVTALTECWGGAKQIAYLDQANYSGKYLKISFKLRRAAGEENTTVENGIQVNDDPKYTQVVKGPVTITDRWEEFVGYYDALSLSSGLNLYFNAPSTSTIYVKDFAYENVAHDVYLQNHDLYDENENAIKISLDESVKQWNTIFTKNGANYELENKTFSKVRIETEFYKKGKLINLTDNDNALYVTVAKSPDFGKDHEVKKDCLSGVTTIEGTDLMAHTIAFQVKKGGNSDYDTVLIKSIKLIE